MNKAPCENCKDRHAKCHAECERYLSWSKERRDAKDRDYNSRIVERYAMERDKDLKCAKLRAMARGRKV